MIKSIYARARAHAMQHLNIFTHLRNPQTIEKISLSPLLYHAFSGTGGRDDAGKFSTRSETQFPQFARDRPCLYRICIISFLRPVFASLGFRAEVH